MRHLYVHLPFCAHRCGYCDFVTVTGRDHLHTTYVDALLRELADEHNGSPVDTIFLGGGTPTRTALPDLLRLLHALPPAHELSVEANPETITPQLAQALLEAGVTRISLGAQSFQPHLLTTLELCSMRVREARSGLRLLLVGGNVLGLERQGIGEVACEVGGLLARDAVDEIERDVVNSGIA